MHPPLEDKKNILDLTLEQLSQHLNSLGEKRFRAKQIFEWVYKKNAASFNDMRNLPSELRKRLYETFSLPSFSPFKKQISQDGTIKFLFDVQNQEYIETVLIPAKGRYTVCVSTQVGCKFRCAFCASGRNGWSRNLKCSEILCQILCVQKEIDPQKITHIVFMGVGEPLDNYENLMHAVRILNAKEAFHIAARRMTVSTCGLIPEIKRFSKEGLQVELAVSLHASNDNIRDQLMPVNKKYPLSDLLATCRQYAKETNRQITFEYILIKDINCSKESALELANKLKGILCKVNLIAYNPSHFLPYLAPSRKEVFLFKKILTEKNVLATIRVSRGQDVTAACGQLRFLQGASDASTAE